MEHQSALHSHQASDNDALPVHTEGKHSKSKQLLKRCINELGPKGGSMSGKHCQSSNSHSNQNVGSSQTSTKLIAPKPIRAALNHHYRGTAKWLHTSPIKNETEDDKSYPSFHQSSYDLNLTQKPLAKKIDFQNEQNLSENGATLNEKIGFQIGKGKKKIPKLDDLESLLEAEQELSSIFNKTKDSLETSTFNWQFNSEAAALSDHSKMSFSQQEKHQTSFSRFTTQFIQRPQCNPMVKDERFKQINCMKFDSCEVQKDNGCFRKGGFSHSQDTSPTANSSNQQLASFNNESHSGMGNFSMATSGALFMNQNANPLCFTQPLAFTNIGDNMQSAQAVLPMTNLASSAPEICFLQQQPPALIEPSYYENLYESSNPIYVANYHYDSHFQRMHNSYSSMSVRDKDELQFENFAQFDPSQGNAISSQEFTLHIEEDDLDQNENASSSVNPSSE